MNKKIIIIIILSWIIAAAAIAGAALYAITEKEKASAAYVSSYLDMSYKIERNFIEKIPVYRDFVTQDMIRELQKFDFGFHTAVVIRHGVPALSNTDDIKENVKNGKLVPVESGTDKLFYYHNVPKENRFLTPQAKAGLELVASRYQQKLQTRKPGLPNVKLAVSSTIRTVDYQGKLFGQKSVSSHSYGGCFDIFFDDYFVELPIPVIKNTSDENFRTHLHRRMGFLMGDALREQLSTVLMETLIELQRENKIYVFLEEKNRCYHITIPEK